MKLLDDDGENKAVRWFLACYGGGGDKSIGTMKLHLEMSGFDGCWPEWCNTEHPSAHLTKGGAQLWIRHLFSLEAQQVAVNHGCQYPMCHSETYQQAVTAQITAELWSGFVVPAGYALVPLEPTPEMIAIGGHVNSEWLNDNAPIGERRYAMPMKSVYEAMLAAAPQPPQGDKAMINKTKRTPQ